MNHFAELGTGGNGISINYDGSEYIDIPDRDYYVSLDTKINKSVNEQIIKKGVMFFMPVDINDINIYNQEYILQIYGILADGSKAEVQLKNIPVFFDVAVPDVVSNESFHRDLSLYISENIKQNNNNVPAFSIEQIYAKALHGFTTKEKAFERVFTDTTSSRYELLKIVNGMNGVETYSNDPNYYYRKAARERLLSLSDWVTLENYEYSKDEFHTFKLSYSNYKQINDPKIRSLSCIQKDKTLVATWDIETYSSSNTGLVPMGENDEDSVFMICLTFHWLHDPDPFYSVCIVDRETESDSRWTTIICGNQENIIRAMALVLNRLRPDIITGFNDGGYDWRFVMHKVIKLEILEWFWKKISCEKKPRQEKYITNYNFNVRREKEIKINAENTVKVICPIIPGLVCIDTSVCFTKIYTKLEMNKYGTLKFYLNDNGLPTKVDLPIITLWNYYKKGTDKNMREIAYYCIVDSLSVQRLLVKRSIISDYREISTLAYISLSDVHYYANGVRVGNLVGSYAFQAGILVNTKPKYSPPEKYPGAYVFQPDKGMVPDIDRLNNLKNAKTDEEIEKSIKEFANDRPVTCLDFASLYPSLIMTYNLSPEKIVKDVNEKEALERQGYKLHEINFSTLNRNIIAWSVMHNNDPEQMGLFPTILLKLFNKRKEMKGLLKKYNDEKEIYDIIKSGKSVEEIKDSFNIEIDKLKSDVTVSLGSSLEEELESRQRRIQNIEKQIKILENIKLETLDKDYADICFNRSCIDKKQNALKIYMNTFYGETGNHLSAFFLLELAGGITSAGQYNIKLVADYVRDKGFGIKYGDSVMPYTPITIKTIDGDINILTFNDFNKHTWIKCAEYKYCPGYEKEYFVPCFMKTWTENGWSTIKRMIRHRTTKKIYRIHTDKGIVDVTEDHSLLDNNRFKIKPEECTVGKTKLLHSIQDCIMSFKPRVLDFYTKSQIQAQIDFQAVQKTGVNIVIESYDSEKDIYHMSIRDPINDDSCHVIKSIELLHDSYVGYVYDIETEHGSFQAGIGNIIVKNTDSLYLTCPNEYFRDCDIKYINNEISKEMYFTAMVKITLRIMVKIEKEINDFLEKETGSTFLKMENEGCTYPCLFLGKKKYYGIKHLSEVNFRPKNLFIKGIEIIKKGKSQIEKKIGKTIMNESVDINNEKKIIDIVKDILKDSIVNNTWDFEDFVLTSAWKPTKKNQSVQRFMKRMSARHEIELRENNILIKEGKLPNELKYSPLEPGERFSYVLVKNDMLYDYKGCKIKVKIGDIMEYAHIALKEGMKVDTILYLVNYVIGTCARFISSDPQFMPLSKMDEDKTDEYTVKKARDMLEKFVKDANGISKAEIDEQGKKYKKIFKEAMNIINIPKNLKSIITGPILLLAFDDSDDTDVISLVFKSARKEAERIYKKYLLKLEDELITSLEINPSNGSDISNNTKSENLFKYNNTWTVDFINSTDYNYRSELSKMINTIDDISIQFRTELVYIVDRLRNNSFNEEYLKNIQVNENFIDIWRRIIGLEIYRYQDERISLLIKEMKCKRLRTTIKPNKKETEKLVKTASEKI